ncbi:MAG: FAD-dependent monooxygenase, partial [Klebsiella pneumoniae]|nr:FAD-dependent monooxygenase [Klebsiella pneumoniae]
MSPAIAVWPTISTPNSPCTQATRVCPPGGIQRGSIVKKVLIVGAGPVGLIIGCYLNKYGIDFDIIDKNTH